MSKSQLGERTYLLVGLVLLVVAAAGYWYWNRDTGEKKNEVKIPIDVSERPLRDRAKESGLDFVMNFLPNEQGTTFKINLYDHGCGVAVGDYDNDGYDDLYFLNQLGANALYRNKGDGTFEDQTEAMGVGLEDRICVGATFVDFDNDGDQDLYVTSTRGGNVFYKNENKKFIDITRSAGLDYVGHSQSAVFFDFDNDGLLDLYLTNTAEWTKSDFDQVSKYYIGKGDRESLVPVITSPKEKNLLFRNQGNGTFTDVTEKAKLGGRGWCGDAAVVDFDEDGDMDVLVVSMFGPSQLYRNEGNGTFTDVTAESLGATPFGGIGAKVFDYNNDGHLDIYIVDMHSDMWMGVDEEHTTEAVAVESDKIKFASSFGPSIEEKPELIETERQVAVDLGFKLNEVFFGNALFMSDGKGHFEEVSEPSNMENFWPWGIATGDFNNDGYEDAYIAAGMGYPFYYWNNYLMMNDASAVFSDMSFKSGVEPPREGRHLPEKVKGKDAARSSRCAATADFDHDGRLEIVTNNFNDHPYYYRNYYREQNYITFKLKGTKSNRDAIGAVVSLTTGDGKTQTRQVHASSGYLSQSSKVIHFGLGQANEVVQVEIRWPNGQNQVLQNLGINKNHEITESDAN